MKRYLNLSLWRSCLLVPLLFISCAQKPKNQPPAISAINPTPNSQPIPTHIPVPPTIDPFPEIEAIDKSNTYWLDTLARFGEGHIFDVTLSPDKSLFAVYTASGIYLYDRVTFAEVDYIPIENYSYANRGGVEDVVRFMPDGRQLVFSLGSHLKLWDFTMGENPKDLQTNVEMHNQQTVQLDFTFDGVYMIQTTNGYEVGGAWLPKNLICEGYVVNIAIFDLVTMTKTYDRYECQLAVPKYRITQDNYIQFFAGSWMVPSYPNYPMRTIVIDPQTGIEMASISTKSTFSEDPFDTSNLETSGDVSLFPTKDEFLKWEDKQRLVDTPQFFEPPCDIQKFAREAYREIYTDEQTSILASGAWGQIYKLESWNKKTCTVENSLSYQTAQSIQFSPTGSMFIIKSSTGIDVWDIKTQTVLFTIQAKRISTPIDFVRFSADESKLFTGSHGQSNMSSSLSNSNPPQPIEVWNVTTGEKTGELQPAENHFSDIKLTHNPEIILTFDQEGASLWDLKTETRINPAGTPFPPIHALDPLRNGVWFAHESEDGYSYELFLVDVNTGEIKQKMAPRNGEVYRINATLENSKLHLFERQGIIRVLDLDSSSEQVISREIYRGYHRTTRQGEIYDTGYGEWTQFFSALDGVSSPKFVGRFVTSNQTLLITELNDDYLIWDRQNSGFINTVHTHYDHDIEDMVISPDSHFIVIVTGNGQVEIVGINRDKNW